MSASWLIKNSTLVKELESEIERLRDALEWYADKENYDTGQDCPDVLIEGGKIARDALHSKPETP